jgi:hypothetical protein
LKKPVFTGKIKNPVSTGFFCFGALLGSSPVAPILKALIFQGFFYTQNSVLSGKSG